jgi:serine/threonine protein kinases
LSNSLYERNARIKDVEAMSEGADVSICVIDTKRKMIDFAGAFQRIIHRHDGQTDVYIGDATFVGSEQNQSYNSRLIHYNPSDFLYLFSDGYSDQLGGEYAKKMRFARFQGHIEAASQHSISQQKEFLLEELAKWQGANAQYDDITILGFQCTFRDFV